MPNQTVVLGVSGGIAAYKVPDLIRRLRRRDLAVEVIMTKAAAEFVTPLTFREVSLNPVHMDMFSNDIQWNVEHISLAKKADLFAVIPATANIIGKIAGGIADDLLTSTIMAAKCPKLIAPAMNSGMYENPILQNNLTLLKKYGYTIVGPEEGRLLCSDEGFGRLATLEELELNIQRLLSIQDLAGEVVLVTAGGTREPLDPVRYIGNRSSGKMGHALAKAMFIRGAMVHLVTTSCDVPRGKGIELYHVDTTAQMREAVLKLAPQASMIIKAAAPADFRPATIADQKLKKSDQEFEVRLLPNPDILLELGKIKRPNQLLIGFAAETNSLREHALTKLKRKNLDLIIGNLVDDPKVGMGAETNRVTIFSATDLVELPELPKEILADKIVDYIIQYKVNQVLLNQ